MAIRREVYITCDGPCGTTFKSTTREVPIPEGWMRLSLTPVHQKSGEKMTYDSMVLCPECAKQARINAGSQGFCWVTTKAKDE
jgi:hypothetical protein